MKFTHISVHPLFSVVFLSSVALSGLTKEMNLIDYVNLNFNFVFCGELAR